MTPETAPWITYRPQLKVLDCTIRDGGLMNNHKFDDEIVKAVYTACVEAGVDYRNWVTKHRARGSWLASMALGSTAPRKTCAGSWTTIRHP